MIVIGGSAGAVPTVGLLAARPAATGSRAQYYASDDGPGLLWLDAAPGLWSLVGGAGTAAVAEKIDGVPTAVAAGGSAADIASVTILIPPCSAPVDLEVLAEFEQTALGGGRVEVMATETGGGTFIARFGATLPNSTSVGSRQVTVSGSRRLGPTVATRTFKLQARIVNDTASTAAGQALNSNAYPSWLKAKVG